MDGWSFVPFSEAQVPIMTHTLHYGYGVFEGIRAYEEAMGLLIFFVFMSTRSASLRALRVGLEIPHSEDEISQACVTLLEEPVQEWIPQAAVYQGWAMGLGALSNTVHVAIALAVGSISWR